MSRVMNRILIFVALILGTTFFANGQCIANAGSDTVLCLSGGHDTILLGGTPIVSGGIPPYQYSWAASYTSSGFVYFNASDFLDDTTSMNPKLLSSTDDSLVFVLTVRDAVSNVCSDTVIVKFCGKYVYDMGLDVAYINVGDSTVINPSFGGGCEPFVIEWSPSYNVSDRNTLSPTVWPDTTTQYSSIITDFSGCQAPGGSFTVYVSPVGFEEPSDRHRVSVYPQPMTDNCLITIYSTAASSFELVIYDSSGRVKSKMSIGLQHRLYRADYEPGIYYFGVLSESKVVEKGKLVVN